MRIFIVLVVLALALPASANLLQDGGFENTTGGPYPNWVFVDGWSATMDMDRGESGPGGPAEGEHYASLQDGCSGGKESTMTSVVVAPSASVVLTGYWHLGGPAPMQGYIKLVDGSSTNDQAAVTISTAGIGGWAPFQIGPLHITTGHVKIKASWACQAGWNSGVQLSLDGLVLEELVPEPASLGLFALAGLPFLRRRR